MSAASLYIYYRVAPAAADPQRVAGMVRELAAHFACEGALLRRADDADTWMEVYRDVAQPDALLAARAARWARAGELPAVAAHHVERFVLLACASS